MYKISSSITYLSKENTSCLRGLLALAIIFHHFRNIAPFMLHSFFGPVITALGYLCVGMFFFLSGYGLRVQGRSYLITFPRNRILPYYCTYILAVFLYAAFQRSFPTGKELFCMLTWYGTNIDFGWYLQAQLLLYLLFWIVYRKSDGKWCPLIITGLYILIARQYLGVQSIFCFPMGIWWCDYKGKIDELLSKYWLRFFAVLSGSFILLFIADYFYFSNYSYLPAELIIAPLFSALVIIILIKVPIQCRITRFLGTISGEMYIMQGIGFRIFSGLNNSSFLWLYLICTLAFCIAAGWLLHKAFSFIYSLFRNNLQTQSV